MARWSFQGQLSFSWTQCFWVSGSLLGELNIFRLQVCGLPGTSGLVLCWDLPTVPPVSWRGLNQWEILLSLDLSEEWINQILTRLDYGSGRRFFICLDLILLWTLDWMVANCIIWLERYVVCISGRYKEGVYSDAIPSPECPFCGNLGQWMESTLVIYGLWISNKSTLNTTVIILGLSSSNWVILLPCINAFDHQWKIPQELPPGCRHSATPRDGWMRPQRCWGNCHWGEETSMIIDVGRCKHASLICIVKQIGEYGRMKSMSEIFFASRKACKLFFKLRICGSTYPEASHLELYLKCSYPRPWRPWVWLLRFCLRQLSFFCFFDRWCFCSQSAPVPTSTNC